MLQGWHMAWTTTLLIGVAAAAAAIGLIKLGVRGQRVGTHPHCRKCEFDLFGLDAASSRCPECGADLRAARAVAIGERRRRPRWVVGGVMLMMVAAAALFDGGREAKRHFERAENKPTAWLICELRSPQTCYAAEHELNQRRIARQLTEGQLRELALTPSMPMNNAMFPSARWMPIVSIEAAIELRRAGKLSDADWGSVCRHVLVCDLTLRRRVRHGEPIAFRLRTSWSTFARRGVTTVRCETVSASVDGRDGEISTVESQVATEPAAAWHSRSPDTGLITLTPQQWSEIGVGRHRAVVRVDGSVSIGRDASRADLTWRGPIEVDASFDVVPASAPAVEMVVDAALRDRVRWAVTPQAEPNPAWGALSIWRQNSPNPPMDLSFDVILRSRGREFAVGSFTTRQHAPAPFMLPRVPAGCDEQKVDVWLRPSAAEAAKHIDMPTIWGEDVLFRDVVLGPPMRIHE